MTIGRPFVGEVEIGPDGDEQRRQMAQGLAAAGPEAAEEARTRWAGLVERMQAAIGRLWQDHSSDILQTLPRPAEKMTALYAYLERARAARDGS